MTRHFIFILSLFVAASCSLPDSKPGEEKDFYNPEAAWDISYVPIIPPFLASGTSPGQWTITGSEELLHLGKNRGGDIMVHSFGVSKNYIYGETENAQWFLLNTYSLLYSEYSTEKELFETLKKYKLSRNPVEPCDKYFKQLTENKRCYWYPKIGGNYPTFEDFRPDTIYTIIVEGKEKVTGFKVTEPIKKTASKIYYFRMKYDNDKNELFYVSFDHSSPRLINNNEIFAGYSEDNTFLNIAVYTPYPVGQSKGIEEKDRIVISKQIHVN